MDKKEAIEYIRWCMCEGRLVGNTTPIIDEKWQAGIMAIQAIEKLSKIEQIMNATEYVENGAIYSYCYNQERKVEEIREVLESEI